MPEENEGMDLEDLIDEADRPLLEAEAARQGITVAQMAKKGIQEKLTARTRPRAMTGTLQAFRR
jgi:hypothetical protein